MTPPGQAPLPLLSLDTHGIYPWSVLRSDSKPWQDRKKHWRSIVDDLEGREQVEIFRHGRSGRHHKISGGKSRFDPFLAELAYTWYCPPGGRVLDPFAGGATRGVIADQLGLHYTGIDLSRRQVEANRSQAVRLNTTRATWLHGDTVQVLPTLPGEGFDYALVCPPYHSLERYTDDPRDLSRMGWDTHLTAVAATVRELYRCLKSDRFATWVVGDLRGPSGHLRMLPERTAIALEGAGFSLVNHQILVTPVGSMYRMLRRWWSSTRSAGRVHQHVYTVVKGDRRAATAETARSLG